MQRLTFEEVLEATGGRVLFGRHNGVEGISIDSRSIGEKDFFVALKGERFDGHDFVADALKKSAGAIVSIPPVAPPSNKTVIHVDNTLKALQNIARYIRIKYDPQVLGITGTNGKTTTKEMSASILSTRLSVLKNSGNLNNQIGLPLSMLDMDENHEAAVLEMGASAPGDIRELCGIAEPDFGIITNIGYAHIEGFRDIASVRLAKMELLEAVGSAAVNADDEFLMEGISLYKGSLLRFGTSDDADVRASDVALGQRETSFHLHMPNGDAPVRLRLSGMFNVYNALAAASAGYLFGFSAEDVSGGLEGFKGLPMRLEFKDINGSTIISDVYNANPSSMEEAIKELLRQRGKRAIAVLGDMLELGLYSETAHRKLGRWMAELKVDVLIAVGKEMRAAAEEFQKAGGEAVCADDASRAGVLLRQMLGQGDTVLIKGSRSMKMENVLKEVNGYAFNAEGGGNG
ncbi:MAG: UDP-N-acetylmuramoyl-tripeptide--D-alanyl-D-alanine ligase [Thermodesulfovibrionales bacterium]|nr:UDP-N-acetylmuramoyl-tripeptide--D-alanyl-D-alanine ligase [Thermodesulfovibrionales bacterium]